LYQSHLATNTAYMSSSVSDNEQKQKKENTRSLTMSGHVGFESLPDQLVNRSIQQGFCFNILCVGESGIGKSTLIDTLFNTNFEDHESSHFYPHVRLKAQTYDLQESNVRLKLTIVNTVGFGDQINKEESYQPIVDYIDAQFEAYLQEELKIQRSLFNYHDSRIHVCLYFISPTGHSLKTLDLLTMKSLDSKVNIIPVIAKADAISKTELQKFKIKLMSELVSNGVQIYQFPTDDETIAKINASMNGQLPFAVVGSMDEVKVGNKMVKARQYPWGVVQVENENHCDFVKLREMLICTNMEDLRDQTHTRHYELYRRCRLEEMGFADMGPESKPRRQPTSEGVEPCFSTPGSFLLLEGLQFLLQLRKLGGWREEDRAELQAKFEHLKRVHQEEKMKLEEKRRLLEEEIIAFSKKKATSEIYQNQPYGAPGGNPRRDKDRK
uniref:Septin n=1 Tax=Sus scrofa TaxID=9823 RepID=A0A8D1CBR4_PIG